MRLKKIHGFCFGQISKKKFKNNWLRLFAWNRTWCWIFLNVHEGPQSISKNNKVLFKPGMILSNEPGYYEKGKFGLRIENLIYIKKKNNMKFENLTYVPIDKDLIVKKMLNKKVKVAQ